MVLTSLLEDAYVTGVLDAALKIELRKATKSPGEISGRTTGPGWRIRASMVGSKGYASLDAVRRILPPAREVIVRTSHGPMSACGDNEVVTAVWDGTCLDALLGYASSFCKGVSRRRAELSLAIRAAERDLTASGDSGALSAALARFAASGFDAAIPPALPLDMEYIAAMFDVRGLVADAPAAAAAAPKRGSIDAPADANDAEDSGPDQRPRTRRRLSLQQPNKIIRVSLPKASKVLAEAISDSLPCATIKKATPSRVDVRGFDNLAAWMKSVAPLCRAFETEIGVIGNIVEIGRL